MAELINTNMFGIYYRSKIQQEIRFDGVAAQKRTLKQSLISTYIEWTIRGIAVLVSIFQFLIITSRSSLYCAYTMGLLKFESQWLQMLVTIQLLKVVIFSLWQIKLINEDCSQEDEERFSSIRSDGILTVDEIEITDQGRKYPLSARQCSEKHSKHQSTGRFNELVVKMDHRLGVSQSEVNFDSISQMDEPSLSPYLANQIIQRKKTMKREVKRQMTEKSLSDLTQTYSKSARSKKKAPVASLFSGSDRGEPESKQKRNAFALSKPSNRA